ncbi:transcription initiation factor TFIID subunit 7 [Episyrphus balteatus]|uniref:transcription initiation factor TFIID subunit 7 n=1 Tax=Episyrphus balteatus TaxID=286459 RepID=UPI002485B5D8|nr:transcription initiation factor TFIID subunit 7 [Episyrphus balteatus]
MLEKKPEKKQNDSKPRDDGVELENQFILRIPEEPAKILHEALLSGNLKDRLAIKMDSDLRYGEVRFDHWLLHAKIVDLPTIMECLKTIDNKSFYKTADVCQIMICKEEPDAPVPEDESPNKAKKKDPNKVDKKFLWPHGITPPCKNIRKRRFRKTLKKKYVEAPEIEKEVKRLLRVDNDAVNVKYEIINEDDDKSGGMLNSKDQSTDNEETLQDDKLLNDSNKDINVESDGEEERPSSMPSNMRDVAEHDIFGEEVSSSDDEDRPVRRDIEETSRLSADDSRMSEEYSMSGTHNQKEIVTEFNKSMFGSPKDPSKSFGGSNSSLAGPSGFYEEQKRNDSDDEYSNEAQMTREQITAKISELRGQCDDLKVQQSQKSQEISSIQNPTLKQRLQETLENLLSQIVEKELEIQDYQNML